MGYTPDERERLVDVYMEKFHEIFGEYPGSVGSWFMDAHTLAYMHDRYGVEASCNCKDQEGTDGYTLRGGYWHGAYYPSKVNAYMPAQTKEGQIDLPVFRMLGSDPLYQYTAGVGGAVQSVRTIEPVYADAKDPEWVRWYLRCQTEDPALGYTYFQAGQENSFTWEAFRKGYDVQLPQIAALEKAGKLRVETLVESARAFRSKYPVNPPTACTALEDYTDNKGRTIWFDSRFYRANIFWEGDRMGIRDIHLFDEKMESYYYRGVCTSNKCVYKTLPLVDGCLWSTASDMASLRFYVKDQSVWRELKGEEPVIRRKGDTMEVRWPLKEGNRAEIRLVLSEGSLKATCTDKSLEWCMQMNTCPEADLPFQTIGGRTITAVQDGYEYSVTLAKGDFEDLRAQDDGLVYRITPEGNQVVLKM